ncbi:MAG: cell division protein ZapB [Elusimicrobia bacterium]|nr:cell division protein ZapB [Elusimicrobiota bacterium]
MEALEALSQKVQVCLERLRALQQENSELRKAKEQLLAEVEFLTQENRRAQRIQGGQEQLMEEREYLTNRLERLVGKLNRFGAA